MLTKITNLTGWTKETVLKIILWTLSILFIWLFPKLLFLIYMGNEGFFSYDFFANGEFGLRVFYSASELFLIVASLAMFGIILPIVQKQATGKADWFLFVLFGVMNTLFLTILVLAALSSKNDEWLSVLTIAAVAFFICFHISYLMWKPPSKQIRSFLALIFVIFSLSIFVSTQFATALKLGLRYFGAGGGIAVTIQDREGKLSPPTKGELVLLSPEYAYLRVNGEQKITVFPLSAALFLTVEKEKQVSPGQNLTTHSSGTR